MKQIDWEPPIPSEADVYCLTVDVEVLLCHMVAKYSHVLLDRSISSFCLQNLHRPENTANVHSKRRAMSPTT